MKLWIRRTLGILLLLLMLVPLFYCGLRTYAVVGRNAGYRKMYENAYKENSPYHQGMPVEEMVKKTEYGNLLIQLYYTKGFNGFKTGAGYRAEEFTMELQAPVHYYASPEDREPVLTLEAGTLVALSSQPLDAKNEEQDAAWIATYGFYALPTYERGWRYARPFLQETEGPTVTKEVVETLPWYYVKTEELDQVWYDAVPLCDSTVGVLELGYPSAFKLMVRDEFFYPDAREPWPSSDAYWEKQRGGIEWYNPKHLQAVETISSGSDLYIVFLDLSVYEELHTGDWYMAREGIWYPPDLSLPLFGGLMWPMLGAAVLCLAGGVLLVRKPKKKKSPQKNAA